MGYFEGRFVMISRPRDARALEYGVTLAIEEQRRNGDPHPPLWLFDLQSALHLLWDEGSDSATKADESQPLSQNGLSLMIDVVKASEILGKTPQAVTAYCRAGRLDAVMVRRGWVIDRTSAEALRAEQERKSA